MKKYIVTAKEGTLKEVLVEIEKLNIEIVSKLTVVDIAFIYTTEPDLIRQIKNVLACEEDQIVSIEPLITEK